MINVHDLLEVRYRSDHPGINQAVAHLPGIVADKTDDVKTFLATCQYLAREIDRPRAGADNEHTLGQARIDKEPHREQAPARHGGGRQQQMHEEDAAADHQLRHKVEYEGQDDRRQTNRLKDANGEQ